MCDYLVKLNEKLREHPQFEVWMNFDSIAREQGLFVPKYKSTEGEETILNEGEIKVIYDQVCSQVLP